MEKSGFSAKLNICTKLKICASNSASSQSPKALAVIGVDDYKSNKMEVKEIEFSKLRHAYLTVKTFIKSESSEKVNTLETKIENDLGMAGYDNLELLDKFVAKFELEYQNFNYSKHFFSERELFNSTTAFLMLLNLSVWIPLKTIELLTFNKIKLEKPNFNSGPEREDLTFREMITWYIEKDYVPTETLKYRIKAEV